MPKKETTYGEQIRVIKAIVKQYGDLIETMHNAIDELDQIGRKIDFVLSGKRPK